MALFYRDQLIAVAEKTTRLAVKSADQLLTEDARELRKSGHYDIFLSHSYRDSIEILGLKEILTDLGFTVYIDWIEDKQLDRSKVTRETADLLRQRMQTCSCLLFIVSANSPHSAWMPWELGYFDGIKGKVAILPISDQVDESDRYAGQEYLGLYPYASYSSGADQSDHVWINNTPTNYVDLKRWLLDQLPTEHTHEYRNCRGRSHGG